MLNKQYTKQHVYQCLVWCDTKEHFVIERMAFDADKLEEYLKDFKNREYMIKGLKYKAWTFATNKNEATCKFLSGDVTVKLWCNSVGSMVKYGN